MTLETEKKWIKPIPTAYKGVQFRSRLEARWAIFFEYIQVEVRYEGRTIRGGAGDADYTPDFEAVNDCLLIEVKPILPNREYRDKVRIASVQDNHPILLIAGSPSVIPENRKTPSLGYYFDGDGGEDALFDLMPCAICDGMCTHGEDTIKGVLCQCPLYGHRWFPMPGISQSWSRAIEVAEGYRFDLA